MLSIPIPEGTATTKNATNVEQAFLTMTKQIKDRWAKFITQHSRGSTSMPAGDAKLSTVTPGQSVQQWQSSPCCAALVHEMQHCFGVADVRH
ncbi:hypothetical protein EV702DRAFT_957298 [Suillus placidus]|uniref:Uncharacterized protein n=1 Tax=Suillus placidus TaxID=48579 RepID=A0A9P7A855_9AGAM|nr:hypothetical protein EV702DRAFT_957298 [Suillus placidus]